jgi:SAM-dependent methyltransferase
MTKWQSAIDASYLHMAAEYLKQVKEYTYSRMHLQPGYSVLDVGCGPGIDTTALARLVGSMGKVVGVDYDADTNYTLAHAGLLLENIAQHALASGFLSESELQRLLESFQQLDAERAFFAHLIMVLVAGRKKTSGAKHRDTAA